MPEEQDNKNMTIGNLGLTNAEENDSSLSCRP